MYVDYAPSFESSRELYITATVNASVQELMMQGVRHKSKSAGFDVENN